VGGQNHHIAGDVGSERPLRPRKPMMSGDPAIKLRANGRARPAISAVADVPDIFVQSTVSLKRVLPKSLNSGVAFLQG
jgi:hypothetical protein